MATRHAIFDYKHLVQAVLQAYENHTNAWKVYEELQKRSSGEGPPLSDEENQQLKLLRADERLLKASADVWILYDTFREQLYNEVRVVWLQQVRNVMPSCKLCQFPYRLDIVCMLYMACRKNPDGFADADIDE